MDKKCECKPEWEKMLFTWVRQIDGEYDYSPACIICTKCGEEKVEF